MMKPWTKYEMLSCVHGYHIYYCIWDLYVREMICCESGYRHNLHNRFAVSVKKYDVTIGHLPRKISRMSILFFR